MIFFGHVSPGGILALDHPELYSDLLKGRLANCRVQLDIDRKRTPRSLQQSAYLFAAVYPQIAEQQATPSRRCMKCASRCFCRSAPCR